MGDDASVKAVAKEVDSLLSRSKYKEALMTALAEPPFNSKEQSTKDLHTATVLKAISSLPDAEVEKTINELFAAKPELTDTLMKYLYRGLQEGRFCGALLKWHALVVAAAGHGPIVRAMTDRKTA
jgi:hypothetical protein